eukprot:TRINITY_DN17485_c0_g1_i1.p1 TRINITY_DN17485_c0_g1~~TRINITY_DN17485_c0_g1_i1.p1  ORF type:complete len:187 (-),score=8.62 TRINITY_DN17485_c0_g1_i1:268-804(-)
MGHEDDDDDDEDHAAFASTQPGKFDAEAYASSMPSHQEPWIMEAMDLSTIASTQRIAEQVTSLVSRNTLLTVAPSGGGAVTRSPSTCTPFLPSSPLSSVYVGGFGDNDRVLLLPTDDEDLIRLTTRINSDGIVSAVSASSEQTVVGHGPTREPSVTVPPLFSTTDDDGLLTVPFTRER